MFPKDISYLTQIAFHISWCNPDNSGCSSESNLRKGSKIDPAYAGLRSGLILPKYKRNSSYSTLISLSLRAVASRTQNNWLGELSIACMCFILYLVITVTIRIEIYIIVQNISIKCVKLIIYGCISIELYWKN